MVFFAFAIKIPFLYLTAAYFITINIRPQVLEAAQSRSA
jgi:hypothetical protein